MTIGDSRIARWLQVDPLAEKYPGWSAYLYTMNNPMILIDPNGKGAWSLKEKRFLFPDEAIAVTKNFMNSIMSNKGGKIPVVSKSSAWQDLVELVTGNNNYFEGQVGYTSLGYTRMNNIQTSANRTDHHYKYYYVDTSEKMVDKQLSLKNDVITRGKDKNGDVVISLVFGTNDNENGYSDAFYFTGTVSEIGDYLGQYGYELENIGTKTLKSNDGNDFIIPLYRIKNNNEQK